MKEKKSFCPVNQYLEVFGDKWTLLIIRDAIFLNSNSFGQFRSSGEKIASNILASRLEKLVEYGIMNKTKNPNNKLKFDYTLTQRGMELKPIIMELGKWGHNNIKGTNDVEHVVKNILKAKQA